MPWSPCSPCLPRHDMPRPSVWLCALPGSTGVLLVLRFSDSSDCDSSDLRPFMSCSPDRLARHASHDFIWLSALTGVVGTFCTVLRARRVPRLLRISRIPFLRALVAMVSMPSSPCHAKTFRLALFSDRLHWSVAGLELLGFLGLCLLGSPTPHVVLARTPCTPCQPRLHLAFSSDRRRWDVCTVFRARRVPRIPRIPFLHALVAMFAMPPLP